LVGRLVDNNRLGQESLGHQVLSEIYDLQYISYTVIEYRLENKATYIVFSEWVTDAFGFSPKWFL